MFSSLRKFSKGTCLQEIGDRRNVAPSYVDILEGIKMELFKNQQEILLEEGALAINSDTLNKKFIFSEIQLPNL